MSKAKAIAMGCMKKMSKGGMVPDDKMHMVKSIMKKYAMGGMVDHDEPESMAEAPDYYDPDFLSDEEDDTAINLTYPDPDHKEDTEGMEDPEMKKNAILRKIFMGMNK